MDPISLYEKRDAMRRVLQSRHFAKARKKSRFLEFVCDQTLLGDAEKLNEYLIGLEVYERGSAFNPQEDAIVRVQAHEIRKSLKEYYKGEGKDDPVRIEVPVGHYEVAFTRAFASKAGGSAAGVPQEGSDAAERRAAVLQRYGLVVLLGAACLVLGVLLVRDRSLARRAPATGVSGSLHEDLAWFWKPFLPPAGGPLIVVPNHPLLRATHEGDPPVTISQGYLISKDKLPEFRDTIHYRELKGFRFVVSTTDFTAVGETLGLLHFFEMFSGMGQKIQLKPSRLVDFEAVKRGNTILLGGSQSWSGRIFLYPEGFRLHAGVIMNKHPRLGELPVYRPEFDPVTNTLRRDYALVLMLPNEKKGHRILLIYGIYTQGSQAAIEYVTTAERLHELRKMLQPLSPDRQSTPSFFQVLLETTVENNVPGKASFVSARIIPGS